MDFAGFRGNTEYGNGSGRKGRQYSSEDSFGYRTDDDEIVPVHLRSFPNQAIQHSQRRRAPFGAPARAEETREFAVIGKNQDARGCQVSVLRKIFHRNCRR
jgi:hypothetical protein